MIRTRVFDVIEERGQKQRWLLAELERRGYHISEGYLSQIKAGVKQPGRQFIDVVCQVLGMPERQLFYTEGGQESMAATSQKTSTPKSAKATRTPGKRKDGKINVAIIGVGNCASSLVQGRYFYQDAREGELIPGLMHVNLGGYLIRDINFVAAIDIDANKVGHDLSEAVFTPPNNTYKFSDVPHQGVRVSRGMTHDGLGKYLSEVITKATGPTDAIRMRLRPARSASLRRCVSASAKRLWTWAALVNATASMVRRSSASISAVIGLVSAGSDQR